MQPATTSDPTAPCRRRIALRYWLQGRDYHRALAAMAFNEPLFPGTRKDGVTPAFDHHVSQAQYARTLSGLIYPEEVISTIFFHDTLEDRGLSQSEVAAVFPDDPEFGRRVADAAWRMTKKWRGSRRNDEYLFEEMSRCPISSIAKGCDRIHNVQTMVGVFSADKQRKYLAEVDELFLPMLKSASMRFPQQEAAYQNIRTLLKSQRAILKAALSGTHVPSTD